MRKPGAVIFDMDGVLIDSEPVHCEIEKEIFSKLGIVVPQTLHQSYMGASNEFMYTDLKSRFSLRESVSELMNTDDLYRSGYFERLGDIHLKEGVHDLLSELRSEGLKLAVGTSSSPKIVNVLLNRCEIASFFDVVVTTAEAGASKPSPEVYQLAAQKIGVASENCIVFEDSPNGIRAAKNAGMFCIAVQPDSAFDLSEADFRIRTFKEFKLNRLLEVFNKKYFTED